jgi:hypothetical protein
MPGQFVWDLWWTKWHRDRVFPCQFHYLEKDKKIIIIFIIGLHKKPYSHIAPIVSAAGPFATKKETSRSRVLPEQVTSSQIVK